MDTIKTEAIKVRIGLFNDHTHHYKTREVTGAIIPRREGLAVTRWKRQWNITHLPSGRFVGWPYERKAEAVAAMAKLYALGIPWHLRRRHVVRFVEDNRTKGHRMWRVISGRD